MKVGEKKCKTVCNLEKSSHHRKCCIDDDTSLGNDEKEVIKLKFPTNIIPKLLHTEHTDKYGNTCEAVEEQFRDGSNLYRNVLHVGIGVGDEDEEYYQGDDGDYKDEDSTEHPSVGVAAIHAVMLVSFLIQGVRVC